MKEATDNDEAEKHDSGHDPARQASGGSNGDQKQGTDDPFDPISSRLALIAVAICSFAILSGLAWMMHVGVTSYDCGIQIATAAYEGGHHPTAMTRRIFLLASGQQVTLFKLVSFGVATLLALIGGVFVLTGARASYRVGAARGDAKMALASSSPGLVIVSLAMGLAVFTLHADARLQDHDDWDIGESNSSPAARKPTNYGALAPKQAIA